MKVAYLGPKASYTHIAAANIFAEDSTNELEAYPTITQVIQALEHSKVDAAVVPVENSLAGGVVETIDALLETEQVYVAKEYTLAIDHCLLAASDCLPADIQKIRSHPITFNQCAKFLNQNCSNAELEPASSNSSAAKTLQHHHAEKPEKADGQAVIASKMCADVYGLKLIQESINDKDNNQTRFWLLSKTIEDYKPESKAKTTIIFQTKDEPGSLQLILRLFAIQHVNLSRIESRPAKTSMGEYMFLVDFDLHKEDSRYDNLMRQVKQHFTFYKWLGSYVNL